MELLQLTYFCDAASTQNFSQTAKRLNVPPSNISQSVKRLEEELGAELADKPFITTSENHSMYNITRDICRELGFKPRIALRGEDPEYVRQCVDLGLGVAFMPTLSWCGRFSDAVEFRSVGEYSRDICIYKRKNGYTSEYVEDFYRMLVETFEKETAER